MKAALLLAAAAVTVAVAIAIARGAMPMAPTGDTAIIENYTLRAEHAALFVGPYSRFQWHHPGPIYFYVLAPLYRAAGDRTTGLFAGVFFINLVSLLLGAWAVASFTDRTVAAAVFAICLVYLLRVPQVLTSAWNPHAIVVPLMAFVIAAAAAASGRVWWLVVAALLASFVVQTHVGVLPSALALSLVAAGAAAVSSKRGAGAFKHALAATLAVVVLAWLLPILEQVRDKPGNLVELWRFFGAGNGIGQPFRTSFAAWSDMLAGLLRPDFQLAHGWLLKRSRGEWSQAIALAQIAGLLALALISWKRRDHFLQWLAVLLLAAAAVSLWSVTRVEGELMDHEIFWISALGALNTAIVLGAAAREVSRAAIGATEFALACAVLFGVVAALGLYQLEQTAGASRAPSAERAAIMAIAADLRQHWQAGHVERPLVKIDQDSWALAAGVLLQLQKQGVDYAVDDDWLPMFDGAARTGREEMAVSISGAAHHYRLKGRPGTAVIAEHDPVFADSVPLAAAAP